jgi:hypothetical protein
MTITIKETFGAHPGAELEVIDEGDKVRVRVREPHGKASIFLTLGQIIALREGLSALLEKTTVVDAARALVRARDAMQDRAGDAAAMTIAHGPEYEVLVAAIKRHDEASPLAVDPALRWPVLRASQVKIGDEP